MRQDGLLPSYERLFGDLSFRPGDESRSVYSPAAYLADLLQLLGDTAGDGGAPAGLVARRPDIEAVPLDGADTYTEVPYLDIVNEVLERQLAAGGADAYEVLGSLRYPLSAPFSLRHQKLRAYLRHLGVDPVELYRRFAVTADPDTVAREYLGLTPAEVAVLTTEVTGEAELRGRYGLGADEPLTALAATDRFRRAAAVSRDELRELVYQDGRQDASAFFVNQGAAPVTLDDAETRLVAAGGVPAGWYERANRFLRLARRTGLSFTDLDLALRACCGNRLDPAALRVLAVLSWLRRELDQPLAVLVSLVAPVDPPGLAELSCQGDPLAARNADYRRRVAAALSISDGDVTATVGWFRDRSAAAGPFDQASVGAAALSLLHRVAGLAAALGTGVAELLGVLDVLDRDPSIRRYAAFGLLVDTGATAAPVAAILAGTDVGAGLWLAQTLVGVVRWMRANGFGATDLAAVLGGAATEAAGAADRAAVLAGLRQAYADIGLAPAAFVSDRFSERAARVVHRALSGVTDGVVSTRDSRLLRPDPERAASAAYAALTRLGVIGADDFTGLGLDERATGKLFANLVLGGYLDADGVVVADRLPAGAGGLRLAGDFSAYRGALFARIALLCPGIDAPTAADPGADDATTDMTADPGAEDPAAVPAEPALLYPSDLAELGLTDAGLAELYDNLVFNGYLDTDGRITDPAFFTSAAENVELFAVNADLGDIAAGVLARLRAQLDAVGRAAIPLDPAIFAPLPLEEPRLADLIASLRYNGYLDAAGGYADPGALVDLPLADLRLALEFYPYRRAVLDAMQEQLRPAIAALRTLTPADLRDCTDPAVAGQVVDGLGAGGYLIDGRVPAAAAGFFADPANTLELPGRTAAESATVFARLAAILAEQRPYHLDPAALTDLGLDDGARDGLLAWLVSAGHLTADLAVPESRLEYFRTVHNALTFAVPGLADFSTDVFFLLHAVAGALTAGRAELTGVLTALAAAQRAALPAVLQDTLGVPAATAAAICTAVAGSAEDALDLLVAPALATPAAGAGGTDPAFRRAFRRVRAFAQLAGKLGLAPAEVTLAYADQDLVGSYPEPLALPPGVDRIDALLESADGHVYLFHGQQRWTYTAGTYELADERPTALADVSARFADLAGVDAAFTDPAGEWIIGRDRAGVSRAFVKQPGGTRWEPRERAWGTVLNNFTDPARVDAAFVDGDGRTYLFAGDQYVRYSGADYSTVDEGFPRRIDASWAGERRSAPLPDRYRRSIDAAFTGLDGVTYLFAGDTFLAVDADPGGDPGADPETAPAPRPIAASWGRVRNALAGADHVDAGYATGAEQYLFAGDQVVRYSDSIENGGVRVDAGYPVRIETRYGPVPAEFETGVQAAFVAGDGRLHLFRDGRTVALGGPGDGTGDGAVVPTARRWGNTAPVLPGGTVDAALAGLDGRTYLFSGAHYLRYSRADYSTVDTGWPRPVAGDWGGLRQVDAAFTQAGSTYLFGAGGLLFEVPRRHAAELDGNVLPRPVRQALAEHGITVPEQAPVTGQAPTWQLVADHDIRLTLTRTGTAIEVHCDPSTEARFHVRYSTRDYTTPDAGYPRPLADNWWNLPADLVGPDAAFARVDAVLTGRDNRTYLFAGDQFVVSDSQQRWWSEPRPLGTGWAGLPFDRVDAAFVGRDGRTYVFSGQRYARFSGDYSQADDRYPAPITPFWGTVANNIARTGRVDAALRIEAGDDGTGPWTYLFSGDQFFRYTGSSEVVDESYPRCLGELAKEPRLAALAVPPDRVDAAFADRRTVYLFAGRRWHAVSDTAYRRYADLDLDGVTCAYLEDGALLAEHADGWRRHSSLEGTAVTSTPARPRAPRTAPAEFQSDVDSVLSGVDGNTYLFKGTACYNAELDRVYPLAQEWGRPRNTVQIDGAVDAAFVGTDGKTYVFRGDQFLSYTGKSCPDTVADGGPRPVAEHWGGLREVRLAFVRGGTTYLFEPPDQTGTARCVAYSGPDYSTPDAGYPRTADASSWDIPAGYRPAGFTMPDAVLLAGNTLLLVAGEVCLARDETTGEWAYPRPLERIWPGIGSPAGLRSAFTGADGATYFFFAGEYTRYQDGTCAPRASIRAHWALTANRFLAAGGTVDAAVVTRGERTYLFSGDQYVRYTGADYRYTDAGYPKPIAGNLRHEEAFSGLPVAAEEELAERFAAGATAMVDAVVANDRTVYLIAGGVCHVASRALAADYDLDLLGRVRNTVAERQRVDAALVVDDRTYLFSGDQCVRYTGADYGCVDEGFPRPLAEVLAGELGLGAPGLAELPVAFQDGLDAAFRDRTGRVNLFAGRTWARLDDYRPTVGPIAGRWGAVHNELAAGAPVDAAFVAPGGALYVFAGGQYARYRPGAYDVVEEGFPRSVGHGWGALPAGFEQHVDGGFVFEGRTYLCSGGDYARYPAGRYDTVAGSYPQPFAPRWSDAADHRLADVAAIARFAALARAHPAGDGALAAFLLPGAAPAADPYRYLADLLGTDADELRWCRRQLRFRTGGGAGEQRVELEFVAAVADLFALTARLGAGPSAVRAGIWAPLYEDGSDAGVDAAVAALYELLARRYGPADWAVLSRQLHDELTVARRDALVPAVLATATGPDPELVTSRDLYERLLVDVDMGSQGSTSRVREAIAATQLYVHRCLLNLEAWDADEATRDRVRSWWSWMRSYRVWEANRKVFLYPENYLRPELRPAKTPAFAQLESDLRAGDITPAAVEQAYKRYLDEYTEVSRLTIAGGYVYTKDQDPAGARRLVLFGRTKTAPRRYYSRLAEFASREKLSATWQPWQPVNVRIDADRVHPVHAFGRVFVFWAVAEAVAPGDGPSTGSQHATICYSFQNLNQQWVPAQVLGSGPAHHGVLSGLELLILPRLDPATGAMSVLAACRYTATAPPVAPATEPTVTRTAAVFELKAELYAVDPRTATGGATFDPATTAALADFVAGTADTGTAARVADIFVDPVAAADVVRFDHPDGAETWPWFSVDIKGGSFLCRPVTVTSTEGTRAALAGNTDRLPRWSTVDAAVELPSGRRFFFDNAAHGYATAEAGGEPGPVQPTAPRWGRVRTVLPRRGPVSAVLGRGEDTFVFFGHQYLKFTGTPFGPAAGGYPKDIATNDDQLPRWTRVDAAFTGRDGTEYFFDAEHDRYAVSGALDTPLPAGEHWARAVGLDAVTGALVTDTYTFVFAGEQYLRYSDATRRRGRPPKVPAPDAGYPRPIAGNPDGLPTEFRLGAALWRDGTRYFIDNDGGFYHAFAPDGAGRSWPLYVAPSAVAAQGAVDAAWVGAGRLYLTRGREYVRYTLAADGSVPELVDDGYPRPLPWPVDAAFTRGDSVYLFTGTDYTRVNAGDEPGTAPDPRPVAGAWGELPRDAAPPFDAALDSHAGLYLFVGAGYVLHSRTIPVPRPYELTALPFELIRLTTGTASELNTRLLSGGVPALLDLDTQLTDELAVSTDPAAVGAIRVRTGLVDEGRLPTGSHLDFRSANGSYYWEIFFHAPLLVARTLNAAQRFEDAKRWYEYVFDPTSTDSYWRFLPFLTGDLAALADTVEAELADLRAALPGVGTEVLAAELAPVLAALRVLAPAVEANRPPGPEHERLAVATVTGADRRAVITRQLETLAGAARTAAQRELVARLRERTAALADLPARFDVLGDRDGLLQAYRDDPFDPQAIADLRPVAHRRSVVMAYVDNLLDWGDQLFTQYTAETIDEARMLYLLAYDLLGDRPGRLGTLLPPATRTFAELDAAPGELDLVGYLTAGGELVTGAGAVHAGVADGYFTIPDNTVFDDYWARVEDRLRKIRQSLNILGVSQPVPLFDPPLDPMALVRAVAGGAALDTVATGAAAPPPPYRFASVFARAQDLTDRLRQFGSQLLDILERRDGEALNLLRQRQEAVILGMTTGVKNAQVATAEATVAELTAGQRAAQSRADHYQQLIDTGLTPLEQAQIGLLATAAATNFASSVLKLAAAIAYPFPQIKLGPFIIGTETGGKEIGDSIGKWAEMTDALGQGFSTTGELIGVKAQNDRSAQDWALQLAMANNDVVQIGHQLEGANQQLTAARRDAEILAQEIAHNEAVTAFLTAKFGSADLYGWMAGQLSGLYFQAYQLAVDMARAAERAYQFERGVPAGEVSLIRPAYWEGRRAGMLAGETLGLDLQRLGKAYADTDTRGLEITKQVSLLALDPVALLRLRSTGSCDFALTEAVYDYDFPGHYRRQLRTVTVTFVDADGQPMPLNATLTQLSHQTVLTADAAGVRHLLDPKGSPPESVRVDWRPGQQIALSEVDGGRDNNGLFELRYDDERYLPFERTGAVSNWRLQRSGRLTAQPYDVIVTVKYTAEQGGELFANAVKGMLKPYPAARFFDLARDFPDAWSEFLGDGSTELALPLTPDLFPGMASRQIGAIYPSYQLAGPGAAHLVIAGLPLADGQPLPTPGLAIGADPSTPVVFTVDGDKQSLADVSLVLSYQAQVQ
jgi:Tc toxin complex TcA C-terminal TcB-binding domain/Neuraminidase-like domain/Salmonella virulence plasmid 28.1kDa A protein/Hemopexin